MSSIIDYAHMVYYFKGLPFSFTDFFCSEEWKRFAKFCNTRELKEIPLNEGINLLVRLAKQKGLPIDVGLYGGIICGDDKEGDVYDAFVDWKRLETRHEVKRLQIMDKFLAKNRCYPYVLYPLFNQQYTSTEKAHQLYTLDIAPYMRRPLFMLVFKYSKRLGNQIQVQPDLNVIYTYDRKRNDPLYDVYVEAGNALWDYVDYLVDKVEVVGRKHKGRDGSIFNAIELECEWVEWMGGKRATDAPHQLLYGKLLTYHHSISKKQRDRARFTVFMEFLWLYLKKDNLVEDNPREQYLKIRKVLE